MRVIHVFKIKLGELQSLVAKRNENENKKRGKRKIPVRKRNRRGERQEIYRRRNGRRDLATFQLTNCKYLDCGCRMTLINIADGTERECRSKGGGKEVYPWRGGRPWDERRQLERDGDGREWREGGDGSYRRRRGRGWKGWSEFLSSLPLDSIQLNFEITP